MSDIDWKARAEAADQALQFVSVTLGGTDEWTDQETMIHSVKRTAEEMKARAEAAEKRYQELDRTAEAELAATERERDEEWKRAEAAEASLVESEEKSDQRLKMALEWKRSRDDYCERLDTALAKLAKAEAERDEFKGVFHEIADFVERHWQGAGLPWNSGWVIERLMNWTEDWEEETDRAESAEAKLAKAREALEPFAEAAAAYDPEEGDDDVIAWASEFTFGALRRARAVLAELEEPHNG